jgi:hypothetical protein
MKQIINQLRPRKGLMKGLAVTLLSLFVLGLAPSMASAQSVIKIGDKAKLLAGGAAVSLPVSVTCDPGSTTYKNLSGRITQYVNSRTIASGYAYTDQVTCDSVAHTVNLFVQPNDGSPPFKLGSAAVKADLSLCSDLGCQNTSDVRIINIVK